jgi:hypothetical protein
MKVKELIDILYKCPLESEIVLGVRDEYPYANSYISGVVEVTDKYDDTTKVYLLHD